MQCSHGRCNYSTFVFECSLYHSITFFLQIRTQVQNLRKRREKTWEFDEVFSPSQTTSDLFEEVEPLVTSVMDGYNVCIFAYGQTGSGKTYVHSLPKILTSLCHTSSLKHLNSQTHQRLNTDTRWKEQRKIRESTGVL